MPEHLAARMPDLPRRRSLLADQSRLGGCLATLDSITLDHASYLASDLASLRSVLKRMIGEIEACLNTLPQAP